MGFDLVRYGSVILRYHPALAPVLELHCWIEFESSSFVLSTPAPPLSLAVDSSISTELRICNGRVWQCAMKKKIHTNIYFDYGGYYSEEHEWNCNNSVYAIMFKTTSLERITYPVLVDKICKKIAIDGARRKMKLSYMICKGRRESYILDDEDVCIFLTSLDKEGFRPVLHVELCNLESNQMVELVPRVERRSSCGLNYGEVAANDVRTDDIRTDDVNNQANLSAFRWGEGSEQEKESAIVNEPIIEQLMIENGVNEDCENDVRHEYVELSRTVQPSEETVKEWKDGLELEKDQEFPSKEAVWDLVNRAAKAELFGVRCVKSDPVRLMIECSQASMGCEWYLRVARIKKSDFWSVRVHKNMHTCSRCEESTTYFKQKGTPRLVASVLHEDFRGQLETPDPKTIMTLVKGRLGLDCSYSTALRGKKQHVSDMRGNPEVCYTMLYAYLHMLREVNPGTVTEVELDAEDRFKYLFIALGASIEGFKAMRKVLVIDATFLKTVYGGMLVIATAQDPNRHHYPIAFGVIDSENHASWNWFFRMLRKVVPDEDGLVFISDRHQSIIKGVMDVFPNASHGHCIWHLSQNLRPKLTGDKDLGVEKFKECAHIYTKTEFSIQYGDFRRRYPRAAEYLDNSIGVEQWARSHAERDKYNIDTSNSAESMNAVFKEVRKYHLLPMIDAILEKFSEWFNNHRKDSANASNTTQVVPVVENILHIRCPIAAKLTVTELNSYRREYSVIGVDGLTYLVDLDMKSCTCRCFDIDKYPCIHGIAAAIKHCRNEWRTTDVSIYGLCSKYYLIETWALAYYKTIYVVPHESQWTFPADYEEKIAKPPDYKPKKGRNQETRFPSTGEKRRKRTQNKARPGINLESWLQPPPNDENVRMPISYTQSSESEPSEDMSWARADGNWGIPRYCFCGTYVKLVVCTTGNNQGRKEYKCPNYEDGGEHLQKWWDDAVNEEFSVVHNKFETQKESIHHAYQNPMLESLRESVRIMRAQLDDLEKRLEEKETQISKLRDLLAKW
ncbi:Zinc finger SWIM-type [Arabidopsis suecica]|uniref:Zinc finger SWIM-type n=1 Tax=Arabidopsis suecica TaxID=45249 RepID=A0A8T2BA13_ARASU|nr:Zinc finger SWIM-type [Arabidopsis suecica]